MTNFKQKEGTGVLFVNDKTKESQPDYKGHLVLDRDYSKGSEIKISGWRKKTPKNHLVSLSIDNYKAQDQGKQWPKPVHDDESIPF